MPTPVTNVTMVPSVGSYNIASGAWTGLNFAPWLMAFMMLMLLLGAALVLTPHMRRRASHRAG